ncbi:N-acetyl-gamma-glutamyl-phosphate reductase [Fulvivirga sp. M361]|uniref:N-acetyl-gamma-glutamyl-phosphate reductase n=1 Tax=Fulvivirga sp. M361 TaxID=2594266 RepID=UPI00117BAED3|nr:N-acetyl-gamma-glutamyl-phosphate reductase [Fulvivirga sp. M361]TRX62150.1 N-acetyl-gamma-glutamyl-phosphate reductase [Fulvivirga sp. M361]
MIRTAIIGGAGYTAGELIRLLIHHPQVELTAIVSQSHAGQPVHVVHQDLVGNTQLSFVKNNDTEVDVTFLCLGHGKSQEYLAKNPIAKGKIIDLSNDFRLKKAAVFEDKTFIYGLPELQKEEIKKARYIANPGCFATTIQLALLPLAHAERIEHEVHVNAITGSTGAGQSLSPTSHFSWRNNNVSVYKAFNHQHLGEITESIKSLQPWFDESINFIPVRGNFTRGIMATAYTKISLNVDELKSLYEEYYEKSVFTYVSTQPIHLKQVVNTNKCLLHIEKHGPYALVTSMIDNLLKGASGQAIQNMNLLFGLEEDLGLKLKASIF